MKKATLRELVTIISTLPDEKLDAEIGYLDLGYSSKEEYKEAFESAEVYKGTICLCCN